MQTEKLHSLYYFLTLHSSKVHRMITIPSSKLQARRLTSSPKQHVFTKNNIIKKSTQKRTTYQHFFVTLHLECKIGRKCLSKKRY